MPRHRYERPRGTLVEVQVDAPSVKDNMLGDPWQRTVAVYLPEGYDTSDADYPLFVDLAAYTSSGLKRLSWTAYGESVHQRVDRLVAEGAMGPAIFAFPDGFTRLGGNQYVDSVALGGWETFVARDLVPQLEAKFRLRKGRAHRAVYGKSSGGYGALIQGLRHADQWAAVACHSGDIGFDLVYRREFVAVCDALARHGGNPVAFFERFESAPKVRGADFHVLMMLAMAASYAPDPDAPLGISLPVDLHTAEVDEAQWQRWLAHDPLRIVDDPGALEQLRSLEALLIDCGSRDQYHLHYGARRLVKKLAAAGIEHTYEEFDDNHSSIDYRLDVSLPRLFDALT
ncbi:MAG: alpha/beta hydrolase [Nannocystaceae bacterium]|nr:esterase family protein [bacterium]